MVRSKRIGQYLGVATVVATLSLASCRTLESTRIFREQAARHPQHVVWIRHVFPLEGDDLAPDLRLIGGVIRYRAGGSEGRLRRQLTTDATTAGPAEAAARAARGRNLWIAPTVGDVSRLKEFLVSGAPVVVWLVRGHVFGAQPEPFLVVGYDSADEAFFCMRVDGRAELVTAAVFEQSWIRAGQRWVLVLPADFNAVALTPDERFERGLFHEIRGDLEKAVADYEAAATPKRSHAVALVRQGNIFFRMNRMNEAESAYRAAIRAAPESAQAYNNLAMLLAETPGRADEAVVLARNALFLDPANPRVLDTLGYALYKSGKPREAADVLERARGRARWLPLPTQAEIAVHLVRVHLANGDVHLAREVLRDALRMAPEVVPQDLRELLK